MRRLTPSGQPDERGVIVIFVALLAIVFLAVAALVVDVGALLQERRELQNGADAAALAAAQECAGSPANCTVAYLTGYVDPYTDANAGDGAAAVRAVSFPGPDEVRVVVETMSGDGGSILPYWFARSVVGEAGKTVGAEATATWSNIGRARTIPLVIGSCEWYTATQNGAVFGQPVTIEFHRPQGNSSPPPCPAHPAGQDLPGGFGWVDSTDCEATISADDWATEKPGAAADQGCRTALPALIGKTVLVPIFDDENGSGGNNGRYHLEGFGAFHLTGYNFAGERGGTTTCNRNTSCVEGHFTRFVSVAEAGGGSQPFGAYTVSLVE